MQLDLFNGDPSPASDGHAQDSMHTQDTPSRSAAHRPPPYRKNSPPGTSDRAALMIAEHAPSLRERILATIRESGPKGLTDDEGEAMLGIIAQTYTPRRGELRQMGLIRDSGERRLTRAQRPAAVWVATEGGHDADPQA